MVLPQFLHRRLTVDVQRHSFRVSWGTAPACNRDTSQRTTYAGFESVSDTRSPVF